MDTFLRRVAGALMLDAGIYEDVEADTGATFQSMAVVVLASLAAGLGATGIYDAAETLRVFVGFTVLALITWFCWAMLTMQIGSKILPTRRTDVTLGQLLRTLGFAASPGLLQAFAVFPYMQRPIFALAIVWTIAASVIAVRHALDYETNARALAVCAVAWILALGIAFVLGMLSGPVFT
jgi:hypothetical protein